MTATNDSGGDRTPGDETLMAYADGETSPAEAEAVEAAAAADPAVAERLALFTRTRALAAEAFPLAPAPDALRASVEAMVAAPVRKHETTGSPAHGETSREQPAPETGRVVPFRRRHPSGARRLPPAIVAVAATLAGVAVAIGGFVAGAGFGEGGPDRSAGPGGGGTGVAGLASLPLDEGLALSSGETLQVAEETVIRPVASFRNGAGAFCREFEVDNARTVIGVACRRNGAWSVDFALSRAPLDAGAYVPASGLEALDAYLGTIDAGPPLSPEEEAKALDGPPPA